MHSNGVTKWICPGLSAVVISKWRPCPRRTRARDDREIACKYLGWLLKKASGEAQSAGETACATLLAQELRHGGAGIQPANDFFSSLLVSPHLEPRRIARQCHAASRDWPPRSVVFRGPAAPGYAVEMELRDEMRKIAVESPAYG